MVNIKRLDKAIEAMKKANLKLGHCEDGTEVIKQQNNRIEREWMYSKSEPGKENLYQDIGKALGFELFVWQKAYIETGHFRKMGHTTAHILRHLLAVEEPPMDLSTLRSASNYSDRSGTHYIPCFVMEVKKIYSKLKEYGIRTREVLFTKKEVELREYINSVVKIDGRNIPYPVSDSSQYFVLHDGIKEVDDFMEENHEIDEMVTQILAIKQSCFLLRNTTYSCQSLSDSLYSLKIRLIKELNEKYNYKFDDDWMESFVKASN